MSCHVGSISYNDFIKSCTVALSKEPCIKDMQNWAILGDIINYVDKQGGEGRLSKCQHYHGGGGQKYGKSNQSQRMPPLPRPPGPLVICEREGGNCWT